MVIVIWYYYLIACECTKTFCGLFLWRVSKFSSQVKPFSECIVFLKNSSVDVMQTETLTLFLLLTICRSFGENLNFALFSGCMHSILFRFKNFLYQFYFHLSKSSGMPKGKTEHGVAISYLWLAANATYKHCKKINIG